MPMPAAAAAIAGVPSLLLRPPPSSSLVVRCRSPTGVGEGNEELEIGSPVVVVVAPPTLKTAVPMPSLKINTGQVKPGDVGRIISRKPKDVWAVRLAIGTYLIDRKHFKPLMDLDTKNTEAGK